jgi:hypothetical protein
MNALLPALPTLTVTTIFYLWFCYRQELLRSNSARRRTLHERVAYMLWQAAEHVH